MIRLLLTLSLAGCVGGQLQFDSDTDGQHTDLDDCPTLQLEVDEVRFDNARINQETHQSLLVTNACAGVEFLVLDASIIGDEAFSLPDPSISVAPGSTGALDVVFFASDEAVHTAELKLQPHGLPPQTIAVWGKVGGGGGEHDHDGDGYDGVEHGGDDCDDSDASVNPGASEIWYDGIDQDCDGADDYDRDGDGYRHEGYGGDDCDDRHASAHPGATEVQDLVDNDCDGVVDEDWLEVGDVLITEVMSQPQGSDSLLGQWFEVYNTTSRDIDLQGLVLWEVRTDLTQVIEDSVVVRAGDYAVLGASDHTSVNGGVSVDYVYDTDQLTFYWKYHKLQILLDTDGTSTEIARHHYNGTWTTSAGRSMNLDPTHYDRAGALDMDSWCVTASSTIASGDYATPGSTNESCATLDRDGDGYLGVGDGGTDCDDDDDEVHPGATEVWGNGKDDDCDGTGDVADIATLADGYVNGQASGDRLAYRSNLSVGDVDGDGDEEIIVGTWYGNSYYGGIHTLGPADAIAATGKITRNDEAYLTGAYTYNYLGAVGGWQGDNTGDGQTDLLVAGHDYWQSSRGNVAGALFEGGSGIAGSLSISSAELTFSDSRSSSLARVHGGLDLDGDGVEEVVHSEAYIYVAAGSSSNYRGRVAILDSDGLSGDVSLDDFDVLLSGDDRADYLGASLGGGDLDGDGYDELFMGAWGDSDAVSNGGAVFVVFGGSTYPSDGAVSSEADLIIQGSEVAGELGGGPEPQVGDFDDDGDADLVVSAYEAEEVYVFLSAGSLSGTVSTSSADYTINGSPVDTDGDGTVDTPDDFGCGLAVGDFNGDGFDDIAVGAPDDDTDYPSYYASIVGEVYLFFGDELGASLSTSDAGSVVSGQGSADAFGQSLLATDLDGDGKDDLIMDAPGYDTDYGRLYFVLMP